MEGYDGLDVFPCGVCGIPCPNKCSNCYQTSYCCGDHQRQDWKNHKNKCKAHPIKYKQTCSESKLKSLVASDNIKMGQLILKEKSILSGPYLDLILGEELKPVCLGCYRKVPEDSTYVCSHCKWPVCDENCEKENHHTDFECKVFAGKDLKPKPLKDEINQDGKNIYFMITTLRALLLREKDPAKWEKLLNLYSYPSLQLWPKLLNYQNIVAKFIKEECGLAGYEDKLIKRVARIIGSKCWGSSMEDGPSPFLCPMTRVGSFLFHDLGFIGEDTRQYSNCVIKKTDISKAEIEIEVFATSPIKTGCVIVAEIPAEVRRMKILWANELMRQANVPEDPCPCCPAGTRLTCPSNT